MLKLALLLLVLCSALHAQPLLPYVRRVGLEQGMSSAATRVVHKDRLGFIWIGTDNGLNRFDGYVVKPYLQRGDDSTSLLDNYIQALEEYRGHVVVGSRRGISIFIPERDRFINLDVNRIPGIKEKTDLYTLRLDADSNLWMGTRHGQLIVVMKDQLDALLRDGRIDLSTVRVFQTRHPSFPGTHVPISDILFDKDGRCWLGSTSGIMMFHPAVIMKSGVAEGTSEFRYAKPLPAFRILQDQRDRLWLTSFQKTDFICLTPGDDRTQPRVVDLSQQVLSQLGLNQALFGVLRQDQSGVFWLALEGYGLVSFTENNERLAVTGTQLVSRYHPAFLPSGSIDDIYIDDQENIWLATNGGLACSNLLTADFAKRVDQAFAGSAGSVSALMFRNGKLWVGTKSDGGATLDGANNPSDLGLNTYYYAFAKAGTSDRVWLGTEDGLFYKDGDGTPQPFDVVENGQRRVYDNVILSIATDVDPRVLWIGQGKGLRRLDTRTHELQRIDLHAANAEIPNDFIIRKVLLASDGAVWAASDQGLVRYLPTTGAASWWSSLEPNPRQSQRFVTLVEAPNGDLLIGTQSDGLYAHDARTGAFRAVPAQARNHAYGVSALQYDASGKLWVATDKGVYALVGGTLVKPRVANLYSNYEFNNNASAYYKGLVLFGHSDGIAAFNPNAADVPLAKTPLRITDFSVSDVSVFTALDTSLTGALLAHREVVLKPSQNFFSFEYALLDYANSRYVTYQYKLDGLDQDWIEAGKRRYASYTHVPPGRYRFMARASSDGGLRWTVAAPVAVRVRPRFDQTPFFWLLIGLSLFGVAGTLLYMRFQQHNQRRERELAEHKAKTKELFLANMSHEIRTPLNAIIGINKLLLEKAPRPDQTGYLEAVQKSSEHLKVIVNDILDFSKIDVGKVELERIPFSLRSVMHAVGATLQLKADAKGLSFVCKPTADTPDGFVGDPYRLTQVLMNLGANAVKFTHQGAVAIGCRTVSLHENTAELEFTVRDTGIGIHPEDQTKLFESFTQIGTSTARQYGGTGLGLAICKQLVSLMNGTIEVDSTPAVGSVFCCRVALPLANDEPLAAQRVTQAADVLPLIGKRVLLVEDNAFNQLVAQESLRHRVGVIDIEPAYNGADALEKLERTAYDLVLMDIVMPDIDGYETTRRIRNGASINRDTPIVAMTANIYKSDIDKCYEAGMNDVVNKPFEIDELIVKMSALLKPAATEA